MDIGTLLGIVITFVAVFVSLIMEGGKPASVLLVPALLIVFGGTIGAAMAGGNLKDFTSGFGRIRAALFNKPRPNDDTVRTLVGFAERARRDGLLALEETARSIDDPYLRKGIELAVDGTDPEELRDIMEADIQARRAEHQAGIKIFADMGGYAPTLGIIGTVLGLIHVLENLSDPDKLGHLIAGAFVATLWGVLSANAVWLPISKKLKRIAEQELRRMDMLLEGVMSIQAGANPRVIEQKLLSFLPAKERAILEAEQAA
ncbi:MAG: MotA/TolQ/ExbB proton channel [Actinomycetia bacterium]|nr:MotA/TolQ/ExbB proton channel [Actinomycetes bacterium]